MNVKTYNKVKILIPGKRTVNNLQKQDETRQLELLPGGATAEDLSANNSNDKRANGSKTRCRGNLKLLDHYFETMPAETF